MNDKDLFPIEIYFVLFLYNIIDNIAKQIEFCRIFQGIG